MSDFNPTKYKNKFNKETYDRASINFPKGKKAQIEEHWKSKGYTSLNAYVNDLIARDMTASGAGDKTVNIGRDNVGTINM